MDIKERFAEKFSSGKWIFTVITALVFAYMSVKGLLQPDKVMEVILLVLYAYFSRKTDTPQGDNNGNSGDSK